MRLGTWCALLALAIQFTLSFGHMHGFAAGSSSGAPPSVLVDKTGAPDAPAVPKQAPGPGFDFCAICAVANLTGHGLPAAAPFLAAPIAAHQVLPWPSSGAAAAASPQRPFRARAPPRG